MAIYHGGAVISPYYNTSGTKTIYRVGTGSATNNGLYGVNPLSGTFDNRSTIQVMTPSATGVTITDGSCAQSWLTIEPGFNYNDASGYSYAIFAVPRRKSNWNAQYNYFYRRNK